MENKEERLKIKSMTGGTPEQLGGSDLRGGRRESQAHGAHPSTKEKSSPGRAREKNPMELANKSSHRTHQKWPSKT